MPYLWRDVEDVIEKMKRTVKLERELKEGLEESETE